MVTDQCQHDVGTMRDGLMGKPRLTRGLGARVLCTAPRRGFPHRSHRASGRYEFGPFRASAFIRVQNNLHLGPGLRNLFVL